MSVFDWLRGEFAKFGLAPLPLRDFDLPDEPSTVRPLLHAVVDTPPAGIHPSQWPVDDYEQVGRECLAKLYAQVTRVADDCADLIELIEQIDPTPLGLANATRPPKRKGRSPRE